MHVLYRHSIEVVVHVWLWSKLVVAYVMPGFHHSVICRFCCRFRRSGSAVVKFRCSVKNYIRKFRSVTAVNSKKYARAAATAMATVYGNGNG